MIRRELLNINLSLHNHRINALVENFEMSRPTLSKHIKILYNAGSVTIQDIGRERYCVLKQDDFNKLQKWIDYFDNFWVSKLKKLETLLNEKANTKNKVF